MKWIFISLQELNLIQYFSIFSMIIITCMCINTASLKNHPEIVSPGNDQNTLLDLKSKMTPEILLQENPTDSIENKSQEPAFGKKKIRKKKYRKLNVFDRLEQKILKKQIDGKAKEQLMA